MKQYETLAAAILIIRVEQPEHMRVNCTNQLLRAPAPPGPQESDTFLLTITSHGTNKKKTHTGTQQQLLL